MTIHLVVPKPMTRGRVEMAEWHELDRKLAVLRLKEELAPRVRRWKRWRWLRRLVGR